MSRSSLLLLAAALLAPLGPAVAQSPAGVAAMPQAAHDIDDFPYLSAPEGYAVRNARTLEFEQKYVFPAGAVRTVEGPYFHADIFADGGQWNETLLLSRLDREITTLGAKRVYDGGLPAAARQMIQENEPRFAKDLYDPWPYRFRQYRLETPERTVWIEVGYGYNAEMVDLTVVVEEEPGS